MTEQHQKDRDLQNNDVPGKPLIKKVGIFLIILSCILYGGLLLVPFIPYTVRTKTVITTALIISGEGAFWVGGIILGKELVTKYRTHLNPLRWFKKKGA